MKLRNRLTGEIVYWEHGPQYKLGKTYESIKEFAEEWEDAIEQMDFDINDLTGNIYNWFDEKGLHDPVMQFAKLNEEVGEMAHELTRGRKDSEEMKDAIGDVFVTLVGMAHHLGLDISECISMAYKEIRGRKGKVIEGSFVKEENMADNLYVLPAFPAIELTKEQAERLARIAREAKEKYEKEKKNVG